MFDYIEKIGQSEIRQDIFSGDYSVSYKDSWGEDITVGTFETQREASEAAERYRMGFDSYSDQILEEFVD